MKLKLIKWPKINKGKLLFGGSIVCISAIVISVIKFSRPPVKSINDLFFISAPFEDLKFTDGSKGYHNYRIWLEKYPSTFKINADFLEFFYRDDFKMISPRSQLRISIAKTDTLKLNDSKATIFLFSIADSNRTYLDSTDTIKNHNSKTDYYLFGGLFVFGCLLLLAGYKSKTTLS